jgi:hypothetical protein
MTEKKLKCVWNMGYDCSGEISEVPMFDDQITAPACEAHYEDHKRVLFLHKYGHDVEEMLKLSPEERKSVFDKVRKEHPDEELKV